VGSRASIRAAIERSVERAVPIVASRVRARLQEDPPVGTPVDTRNASAHWLQTVGLPAPASTGSSPTATLAFADIVRYRIEDGSMFVSNFVPYIRRLNDGSSKQSPAGFVEQAVSAGLAEAAREFRP
jgi:hypothetical protein